ncbi:hypothetical protein [Thiothrix nivea]|uniref:Uncharacterized protein n=1 Tax=Thiothrix nivea (strain ATCC 35100 / DSM 5205 / JP2) TaxID=870187 RepID=A0A656HBJ7_THINJ|nr:hypothetical protein [Thiothrix nivea]EIJ33344.1 hypothetical protein Thini_0707 [Thiothrix nivea DSM 5205]
MMPATLERSDNRPYWMRWDDDTVDGILHADPDSLFDFVNTVRVEEESGIDMTDSETTEAIVVWAMEAAQELQEFCDAAKEAGSPLLATEALLGDLDNILATARGKA